MLKRLLVAAVAAVTGTTLGLVASPAQAVETTQYTQPGDHLVNGRYWRTACENYSDTVIRCNTDIFATKVVQVDGHHVLHNGWTFNNLTYLPSAREQWADNPLAKTGEWTASDGRKWKAECDTELTGQNGCRAWAWTTVVAEENGRFVQRDQWQFNNIIQFSSGSTPPVTTIPAAAPPLAGVPVETEPVSPASWQSCKTSYYWQGSRTANGERYNPDGLTAAHKTLPFGTRVLVQNPNNGAQVTVRINDRGPFIAGRCLDLSRAAMQTIGGTSAGVLTVNYKVLG